MATKITAKIRADKVVGLAHNAGVISIQSGSIITLGGLQYETDVQKSVALPAMTANTRYQVFAVLSAGDVALVISTNENSVGPAGSTSWNLVGSFYSNGLAVVAFGSFIKDLAGVPETEAIDTVLITSPAIANTTLSMNWFRKGEVLMVNFSINFTGSPGAYSSIGINTPTNITADNNKTKSTSISNAVKQIGSLVLHDVGNQYFTGSVMFLAGISLWYNTVLGGTTIIHTSITNSAPFIPVNQDSLTGWYEVFATGWSNTPIKDL